MCKYQGHLYVYHKLLANSSDTLRIYLIEQLKGFK